MKLSLLTKLYYQYNTKSTILAKMYVAIITYILRHEKQICLVSFQGGRMLYTPLNPLVPMLQLYNNPEACLRRHYRFTCFQKLQG